MFAAADMFMTKRFFRELPPGEPAAVYDVGEQMLGTNVGNKCWEQMLGTNVGNKCWETILVTPHIPRC